VLITGESGTGKELVATAIHAESGRRGGPLVPVNCGALPENILESELFGHVRGAFTGAIRDKKGRFELADGGTLFLDEVGELPPSFQVRLLRVLQEKRFERVGGEQQVSVDVRIIAATNRDLKEMVQQGSFREDLFYRLCVVPIQLPPLRDRREDVPPLVGQILERVSRETGKRIERLSAPAMDLLLAHAWPGNIRELINALQFAAVRCRGSAIEIEHLPPEIRAAGASGTSRLYSPVTPPEESAAAATSAEVVQEFGAGQPAGDAMPAPVKGKRTKLTAEAVERALIATGGNKVKAAKLLGVGRATLYRFFQKGR
jgi:transcriptional regulator with GAF, ATPase, and Fis domain